MIVMMLIKPSSFLIITWRETSQPKTYKIYTQTLSHYIPKGEEGGSKTYLKRKNHSIPIKTSLLESSSTALVSSLVKVGFALAIWIPSPDGAGINWGSRGFMMFSVAFGGYGFGSAKNDTENNGNFIPLHDL